MLIGASLNNIDSAGRVFMPAKWRFDFIENPSIVIMPGLTEPEGQKYLQLMPYDSFKKLSSVFDLIPLTETAFDNAKENIASRAEPGILDKQGRFAVPQKLIEYAGLTAEVLLLGMKDHIRIWNPDSHEKASASYNSEKYANDLKELTRISRQPAEQPAAD